MGSVVVQQMDCHVPGTVCLKEGICVLTRWHNERMMIMEMMSRKKEKRIRIQERMIATMKMKRKMKSTL